MKYLAQWIVAIAFAFATFSLPVYGGSYDLPTHGGSGGSSFRLDCGDNKVMIGLTGYRFLDIHQIRAKCRKVSDISTWVGSTSSTESTGNQPYPPWFPIDITCPTNTQVSGISGRFGDHVNKLNLRCTGIRATDPTSVTISAGESRSGDRSFSLESCSDGKAARGFHGRSGGKINSIGLICHAGTTPNLLLLLPPNQLAAINLVNPTGPDTAAVTPFVQLQWTDRSNYESGFRIRIFNFLQSAVIPIFTRDLAESPGVGSRQALNITDLPGGTYNFSVCSIFSTADGGDQCNAAGVTFRIALAPTCNPTITSVEQIGSGTGRVRWSHNCTNPNNFTIRSRSGNTTFTPVITPDGRARDETFSFQNGISSEVRVCAVFPGQGETSFCSAPRSFFFSNL